MKFLPTLLCLLLTFNTRLTAQTGIEIPSMAHCDVMVRNFMNRHDIEGASFALATEGRVVYNRAFGTADLANTEATLPHQLFRIASISKPITSMATMKLIQDGRLNLFDRAFGPNGLLRNHPILSQANVTDTRINNITVNHLLHHEAGWNRNIDCFPNPASPYPWTRRGCDPIGAPLHVNAVNGIPGPLTESDMIYFLLEKGLNHAPGTVYAYSNIGYLVLGEIIETITGMEYDAFVQSELLDPLGICDMHIAGNTLSEKREREVEYNGGGFTVPAADGSGEIVPWEYGGLAVDLMDAHGGWIASARDLLRLLHAVDGFASKPDFLNAATIAEMTRPGTQANWYAKGWSVNTAGHWWHTGSLDGTATVLVRTSGEKTWAFLLNDGPTRNWNQFWTEFDNLPWDCMRFTETFPQHDLSAVPLVNSTELQAEAIDGTSIRLSWTPGDGDRRLVVARADDDEVGGFPIDGTGYTANAEFGRGSDLGGGTFAVYENAGDNVVVTGLTPGTRYHFRVFELNKNATTGRQSLYKLCGNEGLTTDALVSSRRILAESAYSIYPTLTDDVVHIKLTRGLGAVDYQLIGTAGSTALQGQLFGGELELSLRHLPAGVYLLRLRTAGGAVATRKVVRR